MGEVRDGTAEFTGGMDTSRQPYAIEEDKYFRGCNVVVPRFTGRLSQRYGIEHVQLIGDPSCYNNCRNFQAEGYYKSGNETILLRLVDGWILEFRKQARAVYSVRVLNPTDRRNFTVSKGWITTVPDGAIVQDGVELPHYVTKQETRRTDPNLNEIGVGRMGVYVQNRYYYVNPDGRTITAGDFRNPVSIQESIDTNIVGFIIPEETEPISAIGKRHLDLNYVEGGVLSFSSVNNTYSVDVRGDRQNWELNQSGLGKVQETVPDIGAVSSYSYEPYSSNMFFRTLDDGLMSLNHAQEQEEGSQEYYSKSLQVNNWFDRDTKELLSKCYTRKFGFRVLTTTGAELTEDGYVFWNGFISLKPDPVYNGQRLPHMYEGLMTGVRPWAMTGFQDVPDGDELFIDSYDEDGTTRLYRIDEKLDYDINHKGEPVQIESWWETRGYMFDQLGIRKKTDTRFYNITDIPRDLEVKAYSQNDNQGKWQEFYNNTHYVDRDDFSPNDKGIVALNPVGSSKQSRTHVNLPQEKDNCQCGTVGSLGGRYFNFMQYRFELKGAFKWGWFIAEADYDNNSMSITETEKPEGVRILHEKLPDYGYSLTK